MPEPCIQRGDLITGFNYILPVSASVCQDQIAQCAKLGLPSIAARRQLTIIANGPSARDVDLRSVEQPTLALNGSLRLFLEQGLYPTYWAACDPQEEVSSFLPDNPPHNTTYLVASKCHPSVFHKLRNNDVLVWHLKDYPAQNEHRISLCSSITLSASWLMYRTGYTDFEYYGWDGCFMDGKHHASKDGDWSAVPLVYINYGGTQVGDEIVGGRTFTTTRTWAAEAKEAGQFFQLAEYFDIGIKIHGGGMFSCASETLWNAA